MRLAVEGFLDLIDTFNKVKEGKKVTTIKFK
jgi:plasmid replication initiation protein